jgi:hypothetical protein
MGQEGWSTPAIRYAEKKGIQTSRWGLRLSPARKEAGLLGKADKEGIQTIR